MSDVAVETAAVEAPVETEVQQPAEASRTPAEIRQQTRDRANGVAQRQNANTDKPRDEQGRFVASQEPTPEAAQAETASTEAATEAPSNERIELPEGHPLRDRGKQYFDELSKDELRSLINQPVRAREVEEARREAAQLKQQLARIEAERDTWKTQTFSVLQDPRVAATYAELKAVDETIANQWLRGVQSEMEGQVSSQLQEVDATQQTQMFVQNIHTSAQSRYPEWFVRSPEFTDSLKKAIWQYGNEVSYLESTGQEVSLSESGVWEYLDRLYLASPTVKERVSSDLQTKRQAEAERIRKEAAEEVEKRKREELEAAAAKRNTNPLGRLPSNAHTGQQLPNGGVRSPAEIRQSVRNRARGVR